MLCLLHVEPFGFNTALPATGMHLAASAFLGVVTVAE